jgi:hypothetical protein
MCMDIAMLALSSWPRHLRAKSEAQKSHFMFRGVWESVREWTLTLPSELSLWELEFRWSPKSS